MKLATSFLLTFVSFYSSAQETVEGVVLNSKSGLPMPFASVYSISNPKIGTVTNSEGEFRLVLEESASETIIAVSYIGFEKKLIKIKKETSGVKLTISLSERESVLQEVVIMPDDTLKNLLRNAFLKIQDNYPNYGTLIKGFYRETNKLTRENKFLYFSESLIEFYKPPYSNKQYGPVKIIEGGKVELESRNEYSNVYFYAGPYIAQRMDFVKERIEFIDPDYWNRYEYEIAGQTISDERQVYIIKFTSIVNGSFEGKFYLDKESLAFVEAEFKLSAYGIKKENLKNLTSFEYTERKYVVKYRYINGAWNIYVVFQDGLGFNRKSSNEIRYTNEYVSLSFERSDINTIKESEAIPFSGIYTLQQNKFNNDFWKKPEILSRTSDLERTVNFLFKSDELGNKEVQAKNSGDSVKVKAKSKKRLINFARKTSTGISIGYAPISLIQGDYLLAYDNFFSIQKNIRSKNIIPTLTYDFKYFPSRSIAIAAGFSSGLDAQVKLTIMMFGLEWSKNIAGWKKPLYFQPAINLYHSTSKSVLGETKSSENFNVNGKRINADKIDVGFGQVKYGFMPSIQLLYKFKSKISIYCKILSPVLSWSQDKMFIEEASGFVLGRSSANANLNDQGVLLTKNGINQTDSNIHLKDYKLLVNIGVRLGLK